MSSRSFLITVAVAVLISMPAEAQTTLWSGTFTAERQTHPSGAVDVGYRFGLHGEISDDSLFEYRGVAYGIRHIGIVATSDEAPILLFGLRGRTVWARSCRTARLFRSALTTGCSH